MLETPLLRWTTKGLYCTEGDFYIDPIQPVARALITHAHSDHARPGMKMYIAHHHTIPILQLRLGASIKAVGLEYGERRSINGVNISLHPAGHIIGSAQIRVSFRGEVWVVSGDYHTIPSGYCAGFEPIACDTFVTESTFGVDTFQWPTDAVLFEDIRIWIQENQERGLASVLISYALGKAQRLMYALQHTSSPVFVHGSIQAIQDQLRIHHPHLNATSQLTTQTPRKHLAGSLILAPPGVLKGNWIQSLPPNRTAYLSGWAQDPIRSGQFLTDAAFALSDHADFEGLTKATIATGASRVLVYHGFDQAFASHLNQLGVEAQSLHPNHAPTLF
jgi:putative mRNA 3-end processing factor